MAVSDLASGSVLVLLGAMALNSRFDLARWGICVTGIWLLFAPLALWTTHPGVAANDTCDALQLNRHHSRSRWSIGRERQR